MNSTAPTQAVILCGGRGERLRPLTDHLPKPMAPVLGRPFLSYLIDQLKAAGIQHVVLLTGYLGQEIQRHFGDGTNFGVEIQYSPGPAEWETGRRLAEARPLLDEEFVLLYGDNLAPFRLHPLIERYRSGSFAATVTLARKDKGNIRLGIDGTIAAYDSTRSQEGLTHVEIGYMIVNRDAVMGMDPARGSFSIILRELAGKQRLGGYDPGCSYCSISDLSRLAQTEDFLRPRRLILLDRDGTLNGKAPRGEYVTRKEEVFWIEANLEGLQTLSKHGFDFIILSNQAGIGRGVVSAAAVEELQRWMVGELAQRDIRIRDVFICPHHWEDHCACRKPLPGMFFQASTKHGFCLERSLYIGDDLRDVVAAYNATCPCLLIGDPEPQSLPMPLPQHQRAPDIQQAVPWILEHFQGWEAQGQSLSTRS